MQPLPLRAAQDMVHLLHQPVYLSQNFKLWLSYFEIYGGKLYDLLSERRLIAALHFYTIYFGIVNLLPLCVVNVMLKLIVCILSVDSMQL